MEALLKRKKYYDKNNIDGKNISIPNHNGIIVKCEYLSSIGFDTEYVSTKIS